MGRKILLLGGVGSFLIALLHAVIPILDVEAYLACGGWWLLPLLEAGSPLPALLTLSLAAIFFLWSLYAFSGAGLIPRLPLLRTGLVLICAIYILRGLDLLTDFLFRMRGAEIELKFTIFSTISLGIGVIHLIGILATWKAWKAPAAASSEREKRRAG